MGLMFPAVLHFTHTEVHFGKSELALSRFSSCIMLVAYASYLFFQLKSQPNLYSPIDEVSSLCSIISEDPSCAFCFHMNIIDQFMTSLLLAIWGFMLFIPWHFSSGIYVLMLIFSYMDMFTKPVYVFFFSPEFFFRSKRRTNPGGALKVWILIELGLI